MENFNMQMGIRAALQLYIFLEAREDELSGGSAQLYASLRSYLYDRLSIEEMESPEVLLEKLG